MFDTLRPVTPVTPLKMMTTKGRKQSGDRLCN